MANPQRTPTDSTNPPTQATQTRQTTDEPKAPNIDLTSLATAMPQSSAVDNAWTRVEPKKRKRNRRTKRTHSRTDVPTVGSGSRHPVSEQGRDTTAAARDQARGPHRPAEGAVPLKSRRLPEATVTSGRSGGGAEVDRPSTSRGPPANDRTTTTTHATGDNIPTQSRPHFAAPRQGQSGGEAGDGPANPAPSTSRSSQKRDRLDDTISPRGVSKKRKTDKQTHTRGSYARATQPHLSVAVALVPRTNMTLEEADSVKDQIHNEIIAACLKTSAPNTMAYAPAFEGRSFLSEGVLKLWCHDDQALSWLQEVVPRLKSPREGTGLTLIKQTDIPVRVRSALFVPSYKDEIGKLHAILSHQNPWYEVSTWTLYTYQRVEGRTPGVFLVLGIPREQLDKILARGRKVAYLTGSIYIRFFTKDGVSEVPPQETFKVVPEQMDTDVPTDRTSTTPVTDIPTDDILESGPGSPVSEVSSILSSPPPTTTQWEETREIDTRTASLTIQEMLETLASKGDN